MVMLNNQRVYVWCEMDSHGELWSRRLSKYFAHVFWKSTMRSTKQSTQQKPWDTLDTVDKRIHQDICYHLLSFAIIWYPFAIICYHLLSFGIHLLSFAIIWYPFAIHQNSQCPIFHCMNCAAFPSNVGTSRLDAHPSSQWKRWWVRNSDGFFGSGARWNTSRRFRCIICVYIFI